MLPFAEHLPLHKVDYHRGALVLGLAAVYGQPCGLDYQLIHILELDSRERFGEVSAGRYYGLAEFSAEGLAEGRVRHPHTQPIRLRSRKIFRLLEDESEGAGEVSAQYEVLPDSSLAIVLYRGEIRDHDRHRPSLLDALYLVDLCNNLL